MPPLVAALPFIGMAATAIGTGVGVISSIKQGQAQRSAYESQANASRYNAQVAANQAETIRQAGAVEEQRQREKGLRLLGTQEANYGASGVTNEGTPLEIMADTAGQLEKDALMTRYNYAVQRNRALSEAGSYNFMADRSDAMAGYASTAGYMKAGNTLLTGLGEITSSAIQMNSPFSSKNTGANYNGPLRLDYN